MVHEPLLPQSILSEFCRRRSILRLALFGSMSRGQDGPDSDVDLLVEFAPGQAPDYFSLVEMETELSNLLDGRKVDLRTLGELSRYFRDQVLNTARVEYVSG
ncbi:MAG: nucleotidyltransferase family protein [Magnetococcales bacterium]|nr:nucleotidyltransferase family protein [Magnetococcales bacterium]